MQNQQPRPNQQPQTPPKPAPTPEPTKTPVAVAIYKEAHVGRENTDTIIDLLTDEHGDGPTPLDRILEMLEQVVLGLRQQWVVLESIDAKLFALTQKSGRGPADG